MRKSNYYKTDDTRWLTNSVYLHVTHETSDQEETKDQSGNGFDFSALKNYG